MSDIVIDVPAAYTVLDRIVEKCGKEGNFLPEKVRTTPLPRIQSDFPIYSRKIAAKKTQFLILQLCSFSASDVVPDQVIAAMPSRGRKRFVSEGDGGRLKEC